MWLAGLAPPNHMALALAAMGRGDTARAIDHLELAARSGDPFVVHIADHPPFPRLQREPRAGGLYRRLNLPTGQA
jgi:hypothetical protein